MRALVENTKLTKKDLLILQNLHGKKMPGYTDISIKTGLPESTVRYRIERMENIGVIKGYSAIIDPYALGLHMAIVIGSGQSHQGLCFNTVGSSECIVILLDEYQELYNSVIRGMGENMDIREVLPVVNTNIPVTTWSVEDILKRKILKKKA
ncbi:winged helix-turn-helix transcriptional regulator [Archaeoglobus veneficus]|uniref:Transcription regulator, AsnC-type n=1 Tax=Archaeoglobus veneficus (strain DSM 11195 / SNP6) TaxID=693661 RepID=F2KNQ9_ARCVS|nr:winged helix-turn-helix transcriptional regulator [Archaeoglobus veneficus]AEA46287.1 Transcription regulator, AsnC-type [Archaeoglobus veneficus SNP6]